MNDPLLTVIEYCYTTNLVLYFSVCVCEQALLMSFRNTYLNYTLLIIVLLSQLNSTKDKFGVIRELVGPPQKE